MKFVAFVGMLLLVAAYAGAETYSWTDENGTYNFTDDLSNVPKKYRAQVEKRGDQGEQPSLEPEVKDAAAPPPAQKGNGTRGLADNGLYGGKSAEDWQRQMRPLYAEVKRLEQQLVELESLMKNPVGISRARFDALPQEFREAQKQYNEALKSYNDLNDAANPTGLPPEFRK